MTPEHYQTVASSERRVDWKYSESLALESTFGLSYVSFGGAMWDPVKWGNPAQWVAAIGTTSAVIVALFKDAFFAWRRRPVLSITGVMGPPHSHQIPMQGVFQLTSGTFLEISSYHFRMWIQNDGKSRANEVQVFVARLSQRETDGTFHVDNHFLPMNFQWAHSHEIYAEGISPKMGKHCDLGHVVDPQHRAKVREDLSTVPAGNTVFALALEAPPTSMTHLLEPGTYRLEIRIAAANSAPIETVLELVHTGNWFDDEEQMFRDGVSVRVLK